MSVESFRIEGSVAGEAGEEGGGDLILRVF